MNRETAKPGEPPHLEVFLAGSEPELPYLYARAFQENGVKANVAFEGGVVAAVQHLAERAEESPTPYDLLIVDFRLNDTDGPGFLSQIAEDGDPGMTVKVAFCPDPKSAEGNALRQAGAEQVFTRQWQFGGLVREVADLHAFWLRRATRIYV